MGYNFLETVNPNVRLGFLNSTHGFGKLLKSRGMNVQVSRPCASNVNYSYEREFQRTAPAIQHQAFTAGSLSKRCTIYRIFSEKVRRIYFLLRSLHKKTRWNMSKKSTENGIVWYRFYGIVFQKRPYRLVSFSVSFFRNDRIVFGIVRYRFSRMTVSFSVSFGIVFQKWPYRFVSKSVSFFRNDRIVLCRNRYRLVSFLPISKIGGDILGSRYIEDP